MSQNDQNWVTLPAYEFADEAVRRIHNYYEHITRTNILATWKESYELYNRNIRAYALSSRGGPQGEYSIVAVNHYRNFLQHLKMNATNSRPAFEPRSTNTDASSIKQTVLARGLLDYYLREKRLEAQLTQAVEFSLLFAESYLVAEWNATIGEDSAVDPETNETIKAGDIEYSCLAPLDVVRDHHLNNAQSSKWYIVRRYRNRYDLAAKYPEYADEIISIPHKPHTKTDLTYVYTQGYDDHNDLVPVWTMYHDRTDSLPDGRQVEFIDENIVLTDGPLAYDSMPVKRMAPSELIGTPFGYTVMYDLIPLQHAINTLYSTIMTNQETFGVQNIAVPRGSGVSVVQITNGLNLIEYDMKEGKPEGLNLTNTPAEVFKFVETLERVMETISGVNSVARGEPQASLKSGAALALVQSQAIQFSQGLIQSYTQLLEDVGQATIDILKTYAKTPRIAAIVGKNNRADLQEFTSNDIQKVNKVLVNSGNPLQNTTAGKFEIAQMLTQLPNSGITPMQLIQVLQSGNLDTLTEGSEDELESIKSENEAMLNGNHVSVMITDNHMQHIMQHKHVVANPDARNDPETVRVVTEHIYEHYRFLSDPTIAGLLVALGQQPIQAPPPPGMGGPGNGQGGAPDLSGAPVQGGDMQPPLPEQVESKLPNMPVNPMTGERAMGPTGV